MFDAHDQIDYSVDPLPWDYELCDAEKSRKLMSRRDMVDAWQNCRIIMWDNVSGVDYGGLTEFQRGEAAMINDVVTEALLDTTNKFCSFGVVGDDELTTYLFEKQTLHRRLTGHLKPHGLRLVKVRIERALEVGLAP